MTVTGSRDSIYPRGENMTDTQTILTRGVQQVLPSAAGLAKLMEQRTIRLYLGIDPTGSNLTLGHAVVLRKLQQFVEAGHEVILLIGSGTVKIGDPTGKDQTRPLLTDEQIEAHFQTWKEQASPILDFDKIKVVYNGDWLDKLTFPDLVKLMAKFTVQQMMERDMFQERAKNNQPIHLHELIYPMLQGYDSVVLDVDLELGGNDQLFNMMVGRTLQAEKNREKYVLAVPLLVGTDGRKMGKSLGNFIALQSSAEDLYGKLMSVTDDVMGDYFRLLTDVPLDEVAGLEADIASGKLHPMEMKKRLAHEITSWLHDKSAAQKAAEYFAKTVQARELPAQIPQMKVSSSTAVLDLVMLSGIPSSKSEARRLLEQGGVELDSQKLSDPLQSLTLRGGETLRVGKRNYFELTLSE
jgi:tyrosyl-tRNA synthetase